MYSKRKIMGTNVTSLMWGVVLTGLIQMLFAK